MNPVQVLDKFLQIRQKDSRPFLLALSGGADSLCLFHALLAYRKKREIAFHVAHVDHGWRIESEREAFALRKLADAHAVPFHCKKIKPSDATGNLENFCRIERYSFFRELQNLHSYQGVLAGHHGDDQSETILKRLLEGAHWSRLGGLKPAADIFGLHILRPFLSLTKAEIRNWLSENSLIPFEDATNNDIRFMRARMRHDIIPHLSESFGKNINASLRRLGHDADELVEYFDAKIEPLLVKIATGPFGSGLDLQDCMPSSLLEIKYLIRKICERHQFFLSKQAVELAATLLLSGAVNRRVESGDHVVWIDRKRLFLSVPPKNRCPGIPIPQEGEITRCGWTVRVSTNTGDNKPVQPSAENIWSGSCRMVLPKGSYILGLARPNAFYRFGRSSIGNFWNRYKVPAFLRDIIPVIWEGDAIFRELLTGRHCETNDSLSSDLMNIDLSYSHEVVL